MRAAAIIKIITVKIRSGTTSFLHRLAYDKSWTGCAVLAFGQRFDQRRLHARDMLAHQHLRPPGFARGDCVINPMMIVVAAADVAMLESDDVATRRHRYMVANPDHFAEHAIAGRGEQRVVEVTIDAAIDGEVSRLE